MNPKVSYVAVPDGDNRVIVFSGKGKVRLSGAAVWLGSADLYATPGAPGPNPGPPGAFAYPEPFNDILPGEYVFEDPARVYAICQRTLQQTGNQMVVLQYTNRVVKVEVWE